MKTKVSGVQNAPDWINSRLNIASEMISEFEDIEQRLSKMRNADTKKEIKEKRTSMSCGT